MASTSRATGVARVRHGRGVKELNTLFLFDPKLPLKPRRKHAKHDLRFRRRKIAAASRRRNR